MTESLAERYAMAQQAVVRTAAVVEAVAGHLAAGSMSPGESAEGLAEAAETLRLAVGLPPPEERNLWGTEAATTPSPALG